jgi:hypothetical protein
MAEVDVRPDAQQVRPSKRILARVVGVFIEPDDTFKDIARKPDFIAPLVLLIVASVAVVEVMLAKIGMVRIAMHTLTQGGQAANMDPEQLNQAIQKGAAIGSIVVRAAAIVGVPFIVLIIAGFGLLILNGFFGERAGFKPVFSATCYAYFPHILGAMMALAVMIFGDPDAFNPQTPSPSNLGFFLNPLTTSHAAFALASSLDLFTVWFLILLAIGLSRVVGGNVRTGHIFMIYFGAWVLLIVVKVGFAMMT